MKLIDLIKSNDDHRLKIFINGSFYTRQELIDIYDYLQEDAYLNQEFKNESIFHGIPISDDEITFTFKDRLIVYDLMDRLDELLHKFGYITIAHYCMLVSEYSKEPRYVPKNEEYYYGVTSPVWWLFDTGIPDAPVGLYIHRNEARRIM